MDEASVGQAYQRLYQQQINSLYVSQVNTLENWRWLFSGLSEWLESLSPFWTAFALTLTETVGAGILALPIATAGIGPIPSMLLLVAFGIINILTIAYIAEAISRSGTIRYGNAFIGQLVQDYLGGTGSVILSICSIIECFLSLWAFYVGFAITMMDVTRIPALIWVGLLFAVGIYFVRGKSLDATVASALITGVISLTIITCLSAIAFTHLKPQNFFFFNVPFVNGRSFDPTVLELIFGVIGSAYFGHLSVSNCAKVVIRRDPSCRSLMLGCMAAQATAMLIYSIWILAVNGAISAQTLASETGTALIPLAQEAGIVVKVLGSVFVILGMGIGSIHCTLGLYNLTVERLPNRSQPILTLPQRQGKIILQPPGKQQSFGISIIYLGLEGDKARLRLDIQAAGQFHSLEMTVSDRWDISALKGRLPILADNKEKLSIEIVQAQPQNLCIRINSSLSVTYEGDWESFGVSMADALILPEEERKLVTWLTRQQSASLTEVAVYLQQDEATAQKLLGSLIKSGLVREVARDDTTLYRVNLAASRPQAAFDELWQTLAKTTTDKKNQRSQKAPGNMSLWWRRLREMTTSDRGYAILAISPIVIVFLLSEWSILVNVASFSELFSFTGLIVVFLLAGIYPVLLLISSRRKGEIVPGFIFRFLSHPVLLGTIYVISLASLFLHGLVIWKNPGERACAIFVGFTMLVMPIVLMYRGAFTPRVVVELRQEMQQPEQGIISIAASGQPIPVQVELKYTDGKQHQTTTASETIALKSLQHANFHIPKTSAQELKIWTHNVTLDGESESLPILATINWASQSKQFDLKLSGGQIVVPILGNECQLQLTFS
ncbi:MAG: hypothetical protein HC773_15310 [Scytonema sp. CRU_2_7]|nr:hypothetical protein [Scytonema sp. CRU_2_7]